MYGKIFDSIYDGTLAEDWRALITFQQFIVLCDADGMVDITPQAMSRRTGIPIEHIKAGIEVLEKADKYSRTPDENGKRIELIDEHRPWGWHIVNHEKYKNIRDADTIRAQTRERVRKHREKKRTVTDGNAPKRHIDTNTNTNTNTNTDLSLKHSVTQARPNTVEVGTIFTYWQNTLDHPRSKLDGKRKSLIKKWLKVGYSVTDLCSAIAGCSKTPHNMGDNDNGQKYDSLELIFRTSDQIDRFMANDLNPPQPKNQAQQRQSGNINAANKAMEIIE